MGIAVVTGASCMCTFGTAPANLNVTSQTKCMADGMMLATIQDTALTPFGMCTSMANPQVASATAAAMGVLTPQPCVPNIAGTWIPSAVNKLADGKVILTSDCRCMCAYAGSISVASPGQQKLMIN